MSVGSLLRWDSLQIEFLKDFVIRVYVKKTVEVC